MPEPLSAQISSRDLLSFLSSWRPFQSSTDSMSPTCFYLCIHSSSPRSQPSWFILGFWEPKGGTFRSATGLFTYTPALHSYAVTAPPTPVRAGGSPSLTLLRRLYRLLWRNPCTLTFPYSCTYPFGVTPNWMCSTD